MPYVTDALIHSTTCRYQALSPNFKILSQIVFEKSVTGNFPKQYIGARDGKINKCKKKTKCS